MKGMTRAWTIAAEDPTSGGPKVGSTLTTFAASARSLSLTFIA